MTETLTGVLSRTASRIPDRIAVTSGQRRISYRDLDRAAKRIEEVLRATGVAPGDRVGIYIPKSPEAIAALFGIMQAGATYVPIDPAGPARRPVQIIRDAAMRSVVTTAERAGRLAEAGLAVTTTRLDDVADLLGAKGLVLAVPAEPLASVAADPGLAYILYTSGSTGVPKGVMISHRAALAFVDWTIEEFGIGENDVVSCPAPLHFDLSVLDVHSSLKAGATIALVPDHAATFPVLLSQFIRDQDVTLWYSVPSALIMMLTRGNFAGVAMPRLRIIFFAGEVFPIKYLRLLRRSTGARLLNLFGPTETNVCTFYEVKDLPADADSIPIGKPSSGYTMFAVNDEGRRIHPGETGELYGGGPGVMSGYWGDAEKTRKVLVPSPLPEVFDGIVCRTGDQVTITEAGDYLYFGRRDHMVKSRGYRIELGEVESVLYGHPEVSELAVVPIPDEEVTNRLKAVIVLRPGVKVSAEDISKYCAERLPKYMVPDMVEFSDGLPRTSTGKVDRQALSRPAPS